MAQETQIQIGNAAEPRPAHIRRLSRLNLLVAGLAILSFIEALAMVRLGTLHGNDFKHLWAGAWLLQHGLDPYDARLLFKIAHQADWARSTLTCICRPPGC